MAKFSLEPEGLEREMMVKEMENGFLIDSHSVCTPSLACDFFNFYAVYGIYFVYGFMPFTAFTALDIRFIGLIRRGNDNNVLVS